MAQQLFGGRARVDEPASKDLVAVRLVVTASLPDDEPRLMQLLARAKDAEGMVHRHEVEFEALSMST